MGDRTLVIATAAKTGGAKTIFSSAFECLLKSEDHRYYVFGGVKEFKSAGPVKYFYFPTSGMFSFFFAVLASPVLAWVLGCKKIVSFSNVSPLQLGFKSVTYFHQLLFFTNKHEMRKGVYFAYVFALKYLMRGSEIIVQNNQVKNHFVQAFGEKYNIKVRWPGVRHARELASFDLNCVNSTNQKIRVLFPVASDRKYKNIDLFLEICKNNPNVDFLSFLPIELSVGNHHAIGGTDFARVQLEMKKADAMVFTSLEETVGLPIFEFAVTGKPVYLYERPYNQWILNKFPFLVNLIFFNEPSIKIELRNQVKFSDIQLAVLIDGEWDFILG